MIKSCNNLSRIDIYDIAKGIGIIFVYIGHIAPTSEFRAFIYSFHMPLFFLISGILLDEKKRSCFNFISNKIKTLFIPLATFVLFSIVVGWIADGSIENIHYGINGALWFLPVLFFTEIVVYALCKVLKVFSGRILCLFGFLIIALSIDSCKIKLPLALSSVPLAAFFLLLGKISKNYILENLRKCPKYKLIMQYMLCILFLLLFVVLGNQTTNMHNAHIAYGPLGIIVAIIGIWGVFAFSKVIENSFTSKLLIDCGKNSLIVFGCHLTMIEALGLSSNVFTENIFLYFSLNALIILLLFCLIKVINNWVPWCIGKY